MIGTWPFGDDTWTRRHDTNCLSRLYGPLVNCLNSIHCFYFIYATCSLSCLSACRRFGACPCLMYAQPLASLFDRPCGVHQFVWQRRSTAAFPFTSPRHGQLLRFCFSQTAAKAIINMSKVAPRLFMRPAASDQHLRWSRVRKAARGCS
jgi:hypothetical protein